MPSHAPGLSLALIAELSQLQPARVLWRDDGAERTWGDLTHAVAAAGEACLAAGVVRGDVIITPGEARWESLVWLLGAAVVGAVVAPLRQSRAGEMARWADFLRIDWRVEAGVLVRRRSGEMAETARSLFAELSRRGTPGLILATGGTTGTPKLVLHDLAALLAAIPLKPGAPRHVLPLMAFDHIGGLDMVWRALAGSQVLVEPPPELSPTAVAATVARHRVDVMPATPSFLNLLLLADVRGAHDLGSLRLVPYGAEPMPVGLLRRLCEAFPAVEFVQRFGTSETGALPVRSEAEGLLLRTDAAGYAWKVVEGELWLRSPARALGYLSGTAGGFAPDGWFRTGDLAEELPGGGFRVRGRRDELINVGGEKVLPGTVEGVLLTHPQVADCRVMAATNAVLGQVVAAEIVWRDGEDSPLAVKRELHRHAGALLPKSHLPVVVHLVPAIETTANMKKRRSVPS